MLAYDGLLDSILNFECCDCCWFLNSELEIDLSVKSIELSFPMEQSKLKF